MENSNYFSTIKLENSQSISQTKEKSKIFTCKNPSCQKVCVLNFNQDSTITATCRCSNKLNYNKTFKLEDFNKETENVTTTICSNKDHPTKEAIKYCPICKINLCDECEKYHNGMNQSHKEKLLTDLGVRINTTCEDIGCLKPIVAYCNNCGLHLCLDCTQKHIHQNKAPIDLRRFITQRNLDTFNDDLNKFIEVHEEEMKEYNKITILMSEAIQNWKIFLERKEKEFQEIIQYLLNIKSQKKSAIGILNYPIMKNLRDTNIAEIQFIKRKEIINGFYNIFKIDFSSEVRLPESLKEKRQKTNEEKMKKDQEERNIIMENEQRKKEN